MRGRTTGSTRTAEGAVFASRWAVPLVSMKMKNKLRKSSEKQKISAMVLRVAEGYIDLGETTQERENYLRSACSAWNIACSPPLEREPAIKQYVEQYQKINKADKADCRALEEDLRLLIKQKDKLYPDVDVQIVGSRIENINGRDHMTVASAKIN